MVQSINAITPLEEARAVLAAHYDLAYTKAVASVTARLRAKVAASTPDAEWARQAPLIVQINRLKHEKRALVLAHRCQSPAICHGIADVVGDTIELALAAARSRQRLVVVCGVASVAETQSSSAPKTVLLPDSRANCSVASSITPDDVAAIREQYPGVPVVAAIASSAAVKEASDICCTAGNALAIVESLPGDRVVLVPDQYLARNLARRTSKKIITWAGTCEALDGVTGENVAGLRDAHPGARIVAHASTAPSVVAIADFSGSLAAMRDWLRRGKPAEVVMVAEQSAVDNAAIEFPEIAFTHGGGVCTHMKEITLENVLWSLHAMAEPVTIREEIATEARKALRQMLAIDGKRR